jgi:hypothetical protein
MRLWVRKKIGFIIINQRPIGLCFFNTRKPWARAVQSIKPALPAFKITLSGAKSFMFLSRLNKQPCHSHKFRVVKKALSETKINQRFTFIPGHAILYLSPQNNEENDIHIFQLTGT